MDYVNLGKSGLKVSRICLGCMSYGVPERGRAPLDARRRAEPAVHQARPRAGHQLLRHRQRLLRRHERGDPRPRDPRLRPARRGRDRDQGLLPDAQGPQRQGPVAQGDHDRDRRQPAAARHGLRRPLPDPSLGLRDADRGDARGAARRREGGQGPVHRRLVDVRLAVLQGAVPGRPATAGRGSSRCRTTTTCSTARRSGR